MTEMERKGKRQERMAQSDKSSSTSQRERLIRKAARAPRFQVSAASARPGAGDRPLWGPWGLRSVELGAHDASFAVRASPGSAV